MRMGAFKDVNLSSKLLSIPSVTDKKRTTSQTTNEITATDKMAIKEEENCFFFGVR